ncbi:aminotransferase class I/II-fold pyridoxal phosphate-dependent enzyme [Pseudoduganella sp. RAF53_2]|uniref:aminotransferase class I/II-fold pyridoxal phosphate-dependent enzyme n=1 Tax=unclassified Pseudoduganella TaxID=2637179 RepID=UPI003F9BE2E6
MGNFSISDVKSGETADQVRSDGGLTPAAHDYPRSHLPISPPLSMASFLRGLHGPVRSILDAGPRRYVTSGRVAIALALREAGVGPGDAVLVPSYHCASMIEPVIWAGATPVFYRIQPNTQVDLDDVATKLDGRCKVLMATNYFGFPQDLSALRAFCDSKGIMLLEDCAHSFLGEHKGRPLGSWGDFAIASSMKFFPIYEGGLLVSSRRSLDKVNPQSAGLGFEAKVMVNTLEDGFSHGRLRVLRALTWVPMKLKSLLWTQIKAHRQPGAQSLAPGSSDGGFGFDPRWLDKRSSMFSRVMLRVVSRNRMGALRRRNYLRLQQALADLPGVRPLFPALPDNVYPWVYPMLVDNPQAVFRALKMDRVPVIRFGEFLWPGVDAAVCPNSVNLSRSVLQLPCHQEMREGEMAWMIEKVRSVVLAQKVKAS